jgi:lactate dehydrogenase-like 2-hydroxyacid dehydrogenase
MAVSDDQRFGKGTGMVLDFSSQVVLVQSWLPPERLAPLASARFVIPGRPEDPYITHDDAIANGADVTAIINHGNLRIDAPLIDAMPNLRIVANMARGYDNLDLDAMTTRGVWGTNCTTAFTIPTAEVALGLMLMTMRRMSEGERYLRSGGWQVHEPGRFDAPTLNGKTLGIIGYGEIGKAIAVRAEAFGMGVIYTQRRNVGGTFVPFMDLLAMSDVVSVSTPLTPETHHLIDRRALAAMKPGAILINTGRGPLVDEQALVEALASGHLGGAGLDVFEREPQVHPDLLTFPNVALTPHLGGGTHESRFEAAEAAVANVVAVLTGNPPLSPVNALA